VSDIEKIHGITPDLTKENVDRLLALFPDVATEITDPKTGRTERAVDFDALKERLGDVAEGNRERYQFTWPGKREAKRLAREPIAKTLRPVKERSKDWDTTRNLYIEGDNLDALKLLRENYAGKVKLIYIDPPYNTGHDFIYKDNFGKTVAAAKSESGDYNDEGGQLVANPESNGRFHSDWCSMIYPRLLLAKDLLATDGFIFISIDSNEITNMITICNEVFGEVNRRNIIAVRRGIKNVQAQFEDVSALSQGHEYILMYSKNVITRIPKLMLQHDGKPGKWDTFWRGTDRPTMRYEIFGVKPETGQWRWSKDHGMEAKNNYERYLQYSKINSISLDEYYLNHLASTSEKINFVRKNEDGTVQYYVPPSNGKLLSDNWMDLTLSGNETNDFDTEKSTAIISRIISWISNNDDIILDFFSGSGTTAHSTMLCNSEDGFSRRFILVQIPEAANKSENLTICEIGEERIRRAGEKIKSNIEAENAQLALDDTSRKVPDIGFRVLCVDDSNYEDRRKLVDEYSQKDIDDDVDITKMDRSDLDLLFEALPKFQLPYSSKIDVLSGGEFDGHTVYSVNDGQLLACFEDSIPESLVRAMAAFRPRPSYVLVSENGFLNSAARTNFTEIFKQSADEKTGATQIRII